MTPTEIVKHLQKSCHDCNPTPCCELEVLGSEAADLIESLTARAEQAEAKLKEAVADIEELLAQEDYAWCNRKNKIRSNYCPYCGAKMDGKN